MSETRALVSVIDPRGLHARPSARFAARAQGFRSSVFVSCRGVRVSADSLLNLLELQAVQGDELEIVAWGPDADEAVAALAGLVAAAPCDAPASGPRFAWGVASRLLGLERALGR